MLSVAEKVAIIKQTDLFSGIIEEHISEIAARMGEKFHSAGEFLFHEGDAGDKLMVIQQGKVEILKGKEETLLALLEEGDILGEMAPISGGLRSTSAKAKEDVSVLFLKGDALRYLLHKVPQISLGIMQILIRRLNRANEFIRALTEKSNQGRKVEVVMADGYRVSIQESLQVGRGNPKEQSPGRLNITGGPKSKISRQHAEIFFRNGNYFVRDLGSKNGTGLNGVQLLGVIQLQQGDHVQVGEADLEFHIAAS